MIAQNITTKLEGRHYEAFRSFALRTGATTTNENVKRLIETLPEFKNLLNIHENANPSSEDSNPTQVNNECQENSVEAV